MSDLPLENVKVLDLSRVLAGPWCTQQLADLGADVVKVEAPNKGDDTRFWGPPFVTLQQQPTAAYFLSANRGKQSISLNLNDAVDHKILMELVEQADILIHNFLPQVVTKFHLDFDTIKAINKQIIYCQISGYGSEQPFASIPGYDALIQAEAGLMQVTGNEMGSVKVGVAVVDLFTGMYASQAITAALFKRASDSQPRKIEVSLFDCQLQMLANQASSFLVSAKEPQRMGTAHPNIVPYQVFKTKDLPIMIAIGNNQQFQKLCNVLDLNEVINDQRAEHNSARVENREWVVAKIQGKLDRFNRADILEQLRKQLIPASPLQNFSELFNSEIVTKRNLIKTIRNGTTEMTTITGPVVMDGEHCFNSKPPPALNQNEQQILQRWLPNKKYQ